MKTLARLVGCAVLVAVSAGVARADYLTITAGINDVPWFHITKTTGSTVVNSTVGGGSFSTYAKPASLDGVTLEYLYCLELETHIYIPDDFPLTEVTTDGTVHGNPAAVNNAGKIAWLLQEYAGGERLNPAGLEPAETWAGAKDRQMALQAAIWYWTLQGTGTTIGLQTGQHTAGMVAQFATMTGAGVGTGSVNQFLWLSPKKSASDNLQALITSKSGGSSTSVVPEGSSLALLLTGLAPLGMALRRRVRR